MSAPQQLSTSPVIEFGPYRLFSSARRLEKDGIPVKIGSRALDILICLAEQPGRPVSNKTLIKRVWRDMVVEDISLRVNIAGLRKTLSDCSNDNQYIANIPGQGYYFVAPLTNANCAAPCAYPMPMLRQMVGRDALIPALADKLLSQRLVTITGPGGIGKTTTAIGIAHALRSDFNEAMCFIDLASLAAPELLANTMLATLGLSVTGNSQCDLIAWLRDKKFLLVLDNCEHLIDAVASLTELLHQHAPEVRILATSREALRVEGEHVHRLSPLEFPPEGANLSASQAQTFPAVQLFVERARASGAPFELSDDDAPLVAQICRQLDGIALAIELSASRIDTFGIQGTANLLSDGSLLSCAGRRTALPRHQTLTAMVDWSYQLLSDFERKILRRLSVFVGRFSLEEALQVVIDCPRESSRLIYALDGLVAKSLVSVETSLYSIRYRLLESTRVYCREKLIDCGEAHRIAERNATHLAACMEQDAPDGSVFPVLKPSPEQLERLGNLRACINWCFSENGNAILGARLCAACIPTLMRFSLLEECRSWTNIAIAAVAGRQECLRQEMVLQEARAISLMFLTGDNAGELAAIERGLELARLLGDTRHELRLLAGLNLHRFRYNDFLGALEIAIQCIATARKLNDPASMAMAEWMLGVSYHLVGNHEGARQHCEAGMALIDMAGDVSTICFGYDHKIRALAALANALWYQGHRTRAAEMAWKTIREAQKLEHPVSFCVSQMYVGHIFYWNGNWETAEALLQQLVEHADRYMLAPFQVLAKGLKGRMLVRRGEASAGVALLRACMDSPQSKHYQIMHSSFMVSLAEGLMAMGEVSEAKEVISKAAAPGGYIYNAPEIARIQNIISSVDSGFVLRNECC